MAGKNKKRLDQLIVERGMARSREEAKRLILAGEVLVDDRRDLKPGQTVSIDAEIKCAGSGSRYVSRGGEKLEGALTAFELEPTGKVCGDFGASTGGFTDCLLEHGARKVYAFDVGYGQFAWKLRQDERVILRERCNIRYLTQDDFPEPLDMIAIDVSFISLSLILPVASLALDESGYIISLVKPQFEIGKGKVGKGGVVRKPEHWREVLEKHVQYLGESSLYLHQLTISPLLGPAGNVEFLSLASKRTSTGFDIVELIQQTISKAGSL